MEVLIVDNAPDHREYNQPLEDVVTQFNPCQRIDYREVAVDPAMAANFGAVILSGVPVKYDFETIKDRADNLEWVHDTNVPILGICLGHQSLGRLFGATIISTEAEEGTRTIKAIADDPLFTDLPDTFDVTTYHRASVTVPKDFELLARSAQCENQVMRHRTRPVYGVQFHPELPGHGSGRLLLKNFIEQGLT